MTDQLRRKDSRLRGMIRVGESITCEGGHVVCTAARDIGVGSAPSKSDFTYWQQSEPEPGARADGISCEVCGAAWIGGLSFWVEVHTLTGWGPSVVAPD